MDYGDACLPQRFWDKVYPCPVTGCWLWGGAQHDTLPYGIWRLDGKAARAHVSALTASGVGMTEEKPHVLHSCDQPPCVRPEHLRPGTPAENSDDMVRRNRNRVGRRSCLDESRVIELRCRYAEGEPVAALAEEFGIGQSAISHIVRGLHWRGAEGPLTVGRKKSGHPDPKRLRPECGKGHALVGDNLWLKPNKNCRSGFERVCRKCRCEHSKNHSARRKAARAANREGALQ